MTKQLIIPWDLGGTKCAAALVEYDTETQQLNQLKQHSIKLTDCVSLTGLIECFEAALHIKMSEADAICIGAAGIYDGEKLHLEKGYPYDMHFAEAAINFNWKKYCVIHDYAPILCATFTEYVNQAEHIKYLNKTAVNPLGRRVVLGVGTGLGVKDGVLFPNGDFWLGTNEMGHVGITMPPLVDDYYLNRHLEFIRFLNKEHVLKPKEPLTFEKVLSGQGIVRIHQFISNYLHTRTPEEIGRLMGAGEAEETLAFFAWYLGLFVGAVQLAFMPDGGIWITGGVTIKHLGVFDHPAFYKGIKASPAYLEERKALPLAVMCDTQHAFYGGAYYAVKRLLD
jgi:glucokinase